MEKIRILASAAALREFTAEQLAAFSGANLNTVRNVLRRNEALFEPVDTEAAATRRGRPANIYRVIDSERIESEVREFERTAGAAAETLFGQAMRSDPEQERLAAIVVAEDASMRAWQSDDAQEKRLLAETAQRSLHFVAAGDGVELTPVLSERAESAKAFADLAEADAEGGQIEAKLVQNAWTGLANYAEYVPTERARQMLTCLVDVSMRYEQPPALAVLTDASTNPAETLPQFGNDWARIRFDSRRGRPSRHEVLWAQPWALDLVDRQLLLGFVVSVRGMNDDELEDSLRQVSEWHIPTLLLADDLKRDLLVRSTRAGALSLPAGESHVVAETLRTALGALNGYQLVGDRDALGGARLDVPQPADTRRGRLTGAA